MSVLTTQDVEVDVVRLGVTTPGRVRSVTTVHGRTLCYQLELDEGEHVFVKQSRPGGAPAVAAEGRLVRAVAALGGEVPAVRLLALDEETGTAVYQGFQGWRPLSTLHTAVGGPSAAAGAALGAALAMVHGHAKEPSLAEFQDSGPFGRPGTESWFTLTPTTLVTYPTGFRELWARLGPAGQDALLDLAKEWAPTALIHADVKSDNIYVHPDQDDLAVLVDWETAGWGDPRWDLGSLVGDAVAVWVHALTLAPEGSLASWLETAPTPLTTIASYLRAALAAYHGIRPLGEADRVLIVRYAGVYLANRAMSGAMQAHRLAPHSHLVAHLARQFLLTPQTAREMLL